MLDHPLAPIRRNDRERGFVDIADRIEVGVRHGPGMERGDLVVVDIRGDEGLRREFVV